MIVSLANVHHYIVNVGLFGMFGQMITHHCLLSFPAFAMSILRLMLLLLLLLRLTSTSRSIVIIVTVVNTQ